MNFKDIHSSIETFNKLNIVNNIDKPIYIDRSKGNRYELQQFNWTMKQRNYRQKMKKLSRGVKIKQVDNVDSLDELQKIIRKNELSQNWSRLEKTTKLKKLSQYLDKLDVKKAHLKLIKIFTYTKFKEGKLKSSKSVLYDKIEFNIEKIPLVEEYIKSL